MGTDRKVSFTYATPDGTTVIILGVPASTHFDADGREQHDFTPDVASRLQQMVWEALGKSFSVPYQVLSWEESAERGHKASWHATDTPA